MNKRFIRKAAGFFAGLGAFFLVVFLAAVYSLNSELTRNLISGILNANISGKMYIEDLYVSVLSGSISSGKIRIDDTAGRPVIHADHATLDISFFAILKKNLHVNHVTFDKPDVYLSVDRDGELNVTKIFSGKNKKPFKRPFGFPKNVTFDEFTLNNGNIHFSHEIGKKKPDDRIVAGGITITAHNGNMNKKAGSFSLDLGACDFKMEDVNTHLKSLSVVGELNKDRLTLPSLRFISDMGSCDLKGVISNLWKGPEYDLDVGLSVVLKELDKAFGIEWALEGNAAGTFKVSGDWNNPDIIGRAHLTGGKVVGETLGEMDASAELHDRIITIHRLGILDAGGKAEIKGSIRFDRAFDLGFFKSNFKESEMAYDLTAEQVWTDPGKVPWILKSVKGKIESHISLIGKGFFPESMVARAGIWATGDHVRFWDTQKESPYTLKATAGMNHSRITLTQLECENGKNSLDLKGGFNLVDDNWTADLGIRSADMNLFTLLKPYGDFSGSLNVKALLNGTGKKYNGKVTATGSDFAWDDFNLGDLDIKGVLNPSGVLTITEGTLSHDGGVLHGKGDIGFFSRKDELDLTCEFKNLSAGYVLKASNLKGRSDGALTFKNNMDVPLIGIRMKTRDFGWDTYKFGSLDSDMTYFRGVINAKKFTVTDKDATFDAVGSMRILDPVTEKLLDDPICDLVVSGKRIQIEKYYPELKGIFNGDAIITGLWSKPEGHLSVEGENLRYKGQGAQRGYFDGVLDKDVVRIRTCTLSIAPGEDVVVSGLFSPQGRDYDLKIYSTGISLKHIDMLGDQNMYDGKVILDVKGKGTFKNPEIKGKISVADLKVNNEPVEAGFFDLIMKNRKATFDGNLIADIKADARMDTSEFTAELRFNETELNPFFRIAGYRDFGGELSGTATVEGKFDDPDTIKGRADISKLVILNKDMPLLTAGTMTLQLKPGRQLILGDTLVTILEKGKLNVKGEGKIKGDIDLAVTGDCPLSVLQPYTDDLSDLTGSLNITASFKGPMKKPDIDADVNLKSVGFIIPEVMESVHAFNGKIKVASDVIRFENMKGMFDTGQFGIDGKLNLNHYKPDYLSLNIKGESIPVSVPDKLDVKVNPNVVVTGTPDDALIEGSLVIFDGKYYRDVNLNLINMVKKKNRKEKIAVKKYTQPYLRNMGINVTLTQKTPFEVDNNIAYLLLKPDLRILGTLNSPRISGRAIVDAQNTVGTKSVSDLLELETNLIRYQGKEFVVTKGVVDFLNPYKIEPTINMDCQIRNKIRNKYAVYLSISGTLENMKFSLTSDPELPEPDILSLLVLGKTNEEIVNGAGDSTKSAAQLLSGIVSRNLQKSIKDNTGIDSVDINYSNGAGLEGADKDVKVSLGKNLSERMSIKYNVENKNGKTIQQAESIYRFFEELSISLNQDTENTYGAELIYRIEFR